MNKAETPIGLVIHGDGGPIRTDRNVSVILNIDKDSFLNGFFGMSPNEVEIFFSDEEIYDSLFKGEWKVEKTFRIGKEKFTDVCEIKYVGKNASLKERLKGKFLNIYPDRLSSNFKLNK